MTTDNVHIDIMISKQCNNCTKPGRLVENRGNMETAYLHHQFAVCIVRFVCGCDVTMTERCVGDGARNCILCASVNDTRTPNLTIDDRHTAITTPFGDAKVTLMLKIRLPRYRSHFTEISLYNFLKHSIKNY